MTLLFPNNCSINVLFIVFPDILKALLVGGF